MNLSSFIIYEFKMYHKYVLTILVNVDKETFNPSPFSVLLYNIEFKKQKQDSNFSTNFFYTLVESH